jgi:hypothetical protein
MYIPRYKQDSFFACVSYALMGTEERREDVRHRVIIYMAEILFGQPFSSIQHIEELYASSHLKLDPSCVHHHSIKTWVMRNMKESAEVFYEKHKDKMLNMAIAFLVQHSVHKQCDAYTMASLIAYVYNIQMSVGPDAMLPHYNMIFKPIDSTNECTAVYILKDEDIFCLKTDQMSREQKYTLRVCSAVGQNYELATFKRKSKEHRCYYVNLQENQARTDWIYMVYPADPKKYRIEIPEEQYLYVFAKQGKVYECIAASSGASTFHAYFSLFKVTSQLVLVVAPDQQDALQCIAEEI